MRGFLGEFHIENENMKDKIDKRERKILFLFAKLRVYILEILYLTRI